MKRKRGRPSTVDCLGHERIRRYDVTSEGRKLEPSARMLREMIPGRLPNEESANVVRDLILSVAYGCGGWQTANRLLDNPPDRMTADDVTLARLNRIKSALESQGWDYESLRAGLLQTEEI